ncbi:MAG: hypothetical protein QOI34_870 [Verrucomicrobiota bacterium]
MFQVGTFDSFAPALSPFRAARLCRLAPAASILRNVRIAFTRVRPDGSESRPNLISGE